jgi:hypothetical protein
VGAVLAPLTAPAAFSLLGRNQHRPLRFADAGPQRAIPQPDTPP